MDDEDTPTTSGVAAGNPTASFADDLLGLSAPVQVSALSNWAHLPCANPALPVKTWGCPPTSSIADSDLRNLQGGAPSAAAPSGGNAAVDLLSLLDGPAVPSQAPAASTSGGTQQQDPLVRLLATACKELP